MVNQPGAEGSKEAPALFSEDHYQELARQHQPAYAAAQPFPHVVLDDFLPPEVCQGLLQEFPKPGELDWFRFERNHSKKLATRGDGQFGRYTQSVLHQLNGVGFLHFLETLTGITGLIPDPYFEGGGLHQIERGGYLKIHADFNWHKKLQLDRRINFILYLNQDWLEEYKGHLELWDRSMTHCVRKVLPLYNRCVIFNTTSSAYHGHPEKLECPPGWTRKSLALYYYSNGRPADEKGDQHGTLWQERPRAGRFGRLAVHLLQATARVAESPASLLRRTARWLGESGRTRSAR